MRVTLLCKSSAKCKTENRCEKVSADWVEESSREENFRRELYDPVLCRSMAYIHSSSSSLLSADRDGGNLQRQLMGGAVGPTIFNCWWWEGVSWDSRWRIPNECCKSLGLPFIKIQLACSAAGAAVVSSSGRLLLLGRSMLQMAEGSAFTETFEVWLLGGDSN